MKVLGKTNKITKNIRGMGQITIEFIIVESEPLNYAILGVDTLMGNPKILNTLYDIINNKGDLNIRQVRCEENNNTKIQGNSETFRIP